MKFLKFAKGSLSSMLMLSVAGAMMTNQAFSQAKPKESLTKYVDPFIGTGFHGHVFLGANVPFGAVQLGPSNISQGWDWCSGYHISDSTIVGFQHTHLSGTGIGDLGDISIMPTTGALKMSKGTIKDMESGYVSKFSHKEETARPGYYAVRLKRYNIGVRLTTTKRVGFHEYTFPKSDQSHIIIDLQEGLCWDTPVKTYIHKVNDSTIAGYRFSTGWAPDQRIYFSAVFSKPIKNFSVYDSTVVKPGTSFQSAKAKGVVTFATKAGEKVLIKVGISPVSEVNAFENIKAELPGWNFNATVAAADAAWNKELQKVDLKTNDLSKKKTFYTAFYHTMIAPSVFNDYNGDYWGTDKKVHRGAKFTNLTTFSLWDTYRAAHPLFTVLQPERVNDMINTMLAIYQQQGSLPMWHLMANDNYCMVGYSAVPVISDAILKGFHGFDIDLAYKAMKSTAMRDTLGIKFVKKLGYIPADSTANSVSMGMEYAIDDWALARVAKKLGKQEDYQYFSKRGENYKNYYDPKAGFMRGRLSADKWREPYSPFTSIHEHGDFTEGNGWQYTWLVPQDVEGLMKLLGGEQRFTQKLDSLFIAQGDMGKEKSPDISGLIGQYAHGNEPSHHVTYLYAYAGQPWKTAEKVRFIVNNFYTDKPDGIIGNEDVGQMSSWYVFSSLGFYPANPANGLYVFGSPLFDEATLHFPGGKAMHLVAKNNSSKNIYIQKVTLNGKPYTKSYISHADLTKGGELAFEMGDKPNKNFGKLMQDRPYSTKP
ncbi:GH92 family glycosyl hydrolase [Mucilaginibacter sp. RS28]|uniref:GH92 family glycosyl hydrolase n=1 Tax=Mucilaginibacter straminoryzae TaxID=2932774 RepID=A0A9X2BBG6_9SPHI|nr:GH92 family glycosyl hydrolase [Mucilaginibacter straminoryzae]MCJ8209822.1 GH92 family glycosyl hydrolase [Mucilaginibacter straminoryzae]